ncbi:ash family protein [Salmonella enterica]|nr:ash family protein [Salmonella enterica]EJS8565757.1 ash family protein [Salmonella enterica]EJS8570610.1 ash family protein [Salmonella enterica]
MAPLLTHKNRLPPSALMGYISPAPHKTGAGTTTPQIDKAHNRASGFFTCDALPHLFRIMAGRMGALSGAPVSLFAGRGCPVRLATLESTTSDGEFLFSEQGATSWQTANSAKTAIRSRVSTPKPKSAANSIVLTRSHTSFAPNYLTCLATACRYGFLPLWTTSPTISATFSVCLTSQNTPSKTTNRLPLLFVAGGLRTSVVRGILL